MWKKNLFYIGIIVSASGLIGPPLALAAGLAFGLSTVHTYHAEGRILSKFMLQAAVVCLGFGMNLKEVLHAGASGFMYTAISIAFALSFGVVLGRMLQVGKKQSLMISFGTAICGGSAIAAMGPILQANEEEMAVSLGTVFVLNSVALLLFPFIGWRFQLSQTQFGLWAALATAMLKKSRTRIDWPWFILYFCCAAVLASYVPRFVPQSTQLFTALHRL